MQIGEINSWENEHTCMEIIMDPLGEKKFKLIKRPSNLWIVIVVILVAGAVFAMISRSMLIFTPFLVILGLVYIFSGNSFEIGIDHHTRALAQVMDKEYESYPEYK